MILTALSENGGSSVTSYKVYVDDGDQSKENWSQVSSYIGIKLTLTVDSSIETTLKKGLIYRFRVSAVNIMGEGPPSNYVKVALAAQTRTPPPPTINQKLSTASSLFVEWKEGLAGDIQITGYKLYMTEKSTGKSSLVYDGTLNPLTMRYLVQGLSTGKYYAFYVVSIDFNSQSEPSPETVAVVCNQPGHIERPSFVSATKNSISLAWTRTLDDGGCPILGYKLFML